MAKSECSNNNHHHHHHHREQIASSEILREKKRERGRVKRINKHEQRFFIRAEKGSQFLLFSFSKNTNRGQVKPSNKRLELSSAWFGSGWIPSFIISPRTSRIEPAKKTARPSFACLVAINHLSLVVEITRLPSAITSRAELSAESSENR